MQEGFTRGERALHLVDPARRNDHLRRLSAAGIDVPGALDRGQLAVLTWDDTYLRGGRFEARAMTSLLAQTLEAGRARGFAVTRVVGEMGWALQDRPGVEHLVAYERKVHRVLRDRRDPVVCVYDRRRFNSGTALDVLGVHPFGLVDGVPRPNVLFGADRARDDRTGVLGLLRRRYLTALLVGNSRDALDVVVEEALWLEVGVPALYLHVVQAAQHTIGRLWEQGRIDIADEHRATEVARLALADLRSHLPSEARLGKLAVVACVAGERHELGARMVADFLESAGFDVRYLGADVPRDTLVALVDREPPDVLALSATLPERVTAVRETIAAVRAVAGDRVAVAAGGQLFSTHPDLTRELAVELHAPDAAAIAERARRFFSGAPSRPSSAGSA